MGRIRLEVCVEDPAGLAAAVEGGADRIELCAALPLGGLTPSLGFMAAAVATSPVPVYAMIRPRAADFVCSDAELDQMERDIAAARRTGIAGVVLGVIGADGGLNAAALWRLTRAARGLGLTLHRAFDLVPDPLEAIDIAVELGFERILTSGGAATAVEGIDGLEAMIAHAAGRISIMPGAGITPETVGMLLPRLPVSEIHASCAAAEPPSDGRLAAFGFCPPERRSTSAGLVRALKRRIAELRRERPR